MIFMTLQNREGKKAGQNWNKELSFRMKCKVYLRPMKMNSLIQKKGGNYSKKLVKFAEKQEKHTVAREAGQVADCGPRIDRV